MRRLAVLVTAAAVAALLASPAGATYGGSELAAGKCGGKLVLNVHHGVINDVDSGFNGYWAFDAYDRHIRAWETGPGTYCAIVVYTGAFATIVGASSPGSGSSGTFTSSLTGRFDGGYRGEITGTFSPGTNPTRGQLGEKDYGCDSSGSCASPFGWVGTYFTAPSFTYLWWGWSYSAPGHGTWVNASTGSYGDITP